VLRLVHEAQMLHDRLHRITIALALTEEMAAEIFDQVASTNDDVSGHFRSQAARARSTAQECRAFAARLEMLRPAVES
jgi:hypothetical protein